MNLYLLTSDTRGYDVYDSCVVAAIDEKSAKLIHQRHGIVTIYDNYCICSFNIKWSFEDWNMPTVKAKLIGTTDVYKHGVVILASFNAG